MRSIPLKLMLLCALLSSCSSNQADYSNLGLVNVHGIVTLDGVAVKNAVVVLEDIQTGLQSYGLTDAAGQYKLQFDSEQSGIIPGEKKVIVSTTLKILGLNSNEEGGESNEEAGEAVPAAVELIPEVYWKETKLRAIVEESTRELNFKLTKDGSTTGPA